MKGKVFCQNNAYHVVKEHKVKCSEQSDAYVCMPPFLAYSGFCLQ